MIQKTKTKRPSRRKRAYGGAIFASVVFIVLSMMVIKQNEELMQWEGLAKSWLGITGKQTVLANHASTTLEQQVSSCLAENQLKTQQLSESQRAVLSNRELLGIADLNERLFQYTLKNLIDTHKYFEDAIANTEILIKRPSLSGKNTAVIFGVNNVAKGFFVRKGTSVPEDAVYIETDGCDRSVRNITWKNDQTITYEKVSTCDGVKVVTNETYNVK